MKFEKFFKMYGTHFNVMEQDFVRHYNILVKIPESIRSEFTERPATLPEYATEVLLDFENELCMQCEVKEIALPSPTASTSALQRVFATVSGDKVSISNKIFSLIESTDKVYISYDDDDPRALVVTSGFGDDEEIKMIVFAEEYFEEVK